MFIFELPMDNYFRYLSEDSKTEDWGVHVPTCGDQHIYPGDSYPLPGHPDTHFRHRNGQELYCLHTHR